jgi:hypothetical protein
MRAACRPTVAHESPEVLRSGDGSTVRLPSSDRPAPRDASWLLDSDDVPGLQQRSGDQGQRLLGTGGDQQVVGRGGQPVRGHGGAATSSRSCELPSVGAYCRASTPAVGCCPGPTPPAFATSPRRPVPGATPPRPSGSGGGAPGPAGQRCPPSPSRRSRTPWPRRPSWRPPPSPGVVGRPPTAVGSG